MRDLLAIALLGSVLPTQAAAQREIVVEDGDLIPDIRPCVDYVGRGSLRGIGKPEQIDDPDDLLGHAVYRFRFIEDERVLGRIAHHSIELARALHMAPRVDGDMLVLLSTSRTGSGRFYSWERVWTDTAGRPFVAIFDWPDPEHPDWRPQALRRFARRVHYRDAEVGVHLTPADEEAGLIETHKGRTRLLYGLYLDDFPALFEAAKAEDCWR